MESLDLAYQNLLLRYDRGVFELFTFASDSTLRVPVQWLGARLDFKKPDRGKFEVGAIRTPGAVLYGTIPGKFPFTYTSAIVVPLADEPLFRKYFTEIANLTGRTIGP